MIKYDPSKIEKKWQKYWETEKQNKTSDSVKGRTNFFNLVEFPYPSGNLHIGHWYAFGIPDIFARYKRMNGYNVMYPFGVDAFGLPAENAAIKRNISPSDWTKQNIKDMSKQLGTMGAMLDFSRFIDTTDPEYYKWTQWIFLQFYKHGLAYRAKTAVNWCPQDKTVLANEQVIDGKCDRCGNEVEQREREQWMYRITKYADALTDDLDAVDWPQSTKLAQKNWIGRSEGAEITFSLEVPEQESGKHKVTVFTTRPDTLFGATFIVISPEIGKKWLDVGWKASKEVSAYITTSLNHSQLERTENKKKTGIFTEVYAINPANKEKIPVWVADYVLGGYGTGAIMAVPAHDERDFEFAKKYNLKIKKVVTPSALNIVVRNANDIASGASPELSFESECFTGIGNLINSGKFNGMDSEKAKEEIIKFVNGKKTNTYRLRDWGISRQRYWGTPIPMVNCTDCGYIPVPEKDLPIKLPKLDNFLPADDGSSPLARAEKWVNTSCPKCNGKAKRETDTMDTFVDSSWYFIRYTDSNNKAKLADKKQITKWLPVDLYTGGAEHNTMHLLYSRFFTKALNDLGIIDFNEPFKMRRNHGMILGPDGNKMSKSKGNVIDPDKEVAQFGADSVRMYLAFLGPYDNFTGPWNPSGILGVHRFLNRVWQLGHEIIDTKSKTPDNPTNSNLEKIINKTTKKISEDIENLHFNTAISEMMKLLSEFEKLTPNSYQMEVFLKLLAPFAPHISEELWSKFGNNGSIHLESWPKYDEKFLKDNTTIIAIQINGKTRATIEMKFDISQEEAIKVALQNEMVNKYIENKSPQKTIYIKNKIINFVI